MNIKEALRLVKNTIHAEKIQIITYFCKTKGSIVNICLLVSFVFLCYHERIIIQFLCMYVQENIFLLFLFLDPFPRESIGVAIYGCIVSGVVFHRSPTYVRCMSHR